ncbi:unnamed protein product [Eretmochelys imbricata]
MKTGAIFLSKDSQTSRHICSLPTEVGPCTAAIPRWVYNWHSKKCEEFSYGGCNGNKNNFQSATSPPFLFKNNFETKEDCLQACAGQELEESQFLSACSSSRASD